jgi:hypothetical protein
MTVRVYRHTDGSAPVLTGQVGTLVALLDAILVNGYGAKTAAGWTIGFTAANKRAYQQNATGANNNAAPMFLYVDDSGPGAGGAKEARACGFETMSAITPTGTGQFPTLAQTAIGVGTLVIRKSTTADATARGWTAVANGQTLYLFCESGDILSPNLAANPFIFGDFKSYKPGGDLYAVCIIGRVAENSGGANIDPLQIVAPGNNIVYNLNNRHLGHYIARHWTGLGSSVACGKVTDSLKFITFPANSNLGGYNGDAATTVAAAPNGMGAHRGNPVGLPFPNGPDGSLWVSPIYLNHSFAIRGYLAGLWCPLHDRPLAHNDAYTVASGNLNGKTLLAQNIPYFTKDSTNDTGQCIVETSDTWT